MKGLWVCEGGIGNLGSAWLSFGLEFGFEVEVRNLDWRERFIEPDF